jgi:hypothetical protein
LDREENRLKRQAGIICRRENSDKKQKQKIEKKNKKG